MAFGALCGRNRPPWIATLAAGIACGAMLAGATARAASDTAFDVSSYEKKPFELWGYAEIRPERQWLRTDSIGYGLQFPGETRSTLNRVTGVLEVSGVARKDTLRFNFTAHGDYVDDPRISEGKARWFEAYGAWQPSANVSLELGKRALRWGTAYAWSPVAFFERPKDPLDPELSRQGFVMATGSLVRSFGGALKTVALVPVVLPVSESMNSDYGPTGHTNLGGKLYFLWHDTDIDLVYGSQGSRGARWGADFSRNLGTSVEIHGEWARFTDVPRAALTPAGTLTSETRSYTSYVIGGRFLTERETTFILEYYRNGAGYSEGDQEQFFSFAQGALESLAPAARSIAAQAASQGYTRPNSGQHYAYLRVSQKEPFDLLYFTPAVTAIVNVKDGSFSLVPELLYTGITNLELRLRVAMSQGDAFTEYGEKAVSTRVELRVRLFF
jgi:hypothetical protein